VNPGRAPYPADIAVSVSSATVPLDASKRISYTTLCTTVTGDQAGTQLHVFDMVVS
jgi:hypothetical protein